MLPKMDFYARTMLTIIAGCLVWLCAKDFATVSEAVAAGSDKDVAPLIQARRLVLVGENGKKCIELGSGTDGSTISLFDYLERKRVEIGVKTNSESAKSEQHQPAFLSLLNPTNGEDDVFIGSSFLPVEKSSSGAIRLSSNPDKGSLALEVSSFDGRSAISMCGVGKHEHLRLSTVPQGACSIIMDDDGGKMRLRLLNNWQKDYCRIDLLDRKGKTIWAAPTAQAPSREK
jgi:hypothetical protein